MMYTPLHIHTGYSFLKSAFTIDKLSNALKKRRFVNAAISDINVMHGLPNFANEMDKLGIKYLLGMDVVIEGETLSLFAQNEAGYLNISMISTLIAKEEFSLLDLNKYSKGITLILPIKESKLYSLYNENKDGIAKYLVNYAKIFKSMYLGIEIYDEQDIKYASYIRKFANEHQYDCIAFPLISYETKEDAITLKITEAIGNDEFLDKDLDSLEGPYYLLSQEEIEKTYTEKEITNTNLLVNSSSFTLQKKRGHLLHYPNTLGITSDEYLIKLTYEGLINRGIDANNKTYKERADYELGIISDMGYSDYFLIVQDFVRYAKSHDISVGPGRGSAAGSLVAYLLDITEVDPIKYSLIFERFLNPGRKSMPDIDTDFSDEKRDLVVDYVREKYGFNHVANIITFQTIGAKQSLRDIGRVYEYPTRDIDMLSKLIINPFYDLRTSYKKIPAFKALIDSDPYYLNIIRLASKIEGLPRQSGLHAAGIILNDSPIEESMPVIVDFAGHYITQYEMNYLEEQGFLKIDFLGLRNLSIIDRCLDLIKDNRGISLKQKDIPYDDPKIFSLISSLQVMGLFQLESGGMKKAIKTLQPSSFIDVVALLALFRPGPMENIPVYAKRKKGLEPVTYISNELKDILAPTYGIIVYQEQIMQIVTKMAGFSLGEADTFRRVVSKKEPAKMLKLRTSFIKGAINNGYKESEAITVFNHIEKFAGYGFNQSHSIGYAIIACQMGYLKVYYPQEFYAAILETSSNTSDTKFSEYISEIRKRGINVLSPNINESGLVFFVKDKSLLFPLTSIRGISRSVITDILDIRSEKKFDSFFDFVNRTYGKINEKQILSLINAGAFDSLYASRATLRINIDKALAFAKLHYRKENDEQIYIEDLIGIEDPTANMEIVNDDPIENLDLEYETLGIMISSSPLKHMAIDLKGHDITTIADIEDTNNTITICGFIRNMRTIRTKKGDMMAFVQIYDDTGEIETILFPKVFAESLTSLKKNRALLLNGRLDKKDGDNNFIVDSVSLIER